MTQLCIAGRQCPSLLITATTAVTFTMASAEQPRGN